MGEAGKAGEGRMLGRGGNASSATKLKGPSHKLDAGRSGSTGATKSLPLEIDAGGKVTCCA